SLTRLHLRWPAPSPLRAQQHPHHHPHDPLSAAGPPPWTLEESRAARRPYIPCLAALTELTDVEFDCAGAELVLDAGLLSSLAPAWRNLRRLVVRGSVRLGEAAAQALAPFRRLQARVARELGLHDVGLAEGEQGGKLLLRTAALPPALLRLALTNANVLHAYMYKGALPGTKFIFPNAPRRPITINFGMAMPGWYDIASLEEVQRSEDAEGLRESQRWVLG
ncbi:Acyl-protein thioesterase 1, partial [Tetrabaena socialis]